MYALARNEHYSYSINYHYLGLEPVVAKVQQYYIDQSKLA